jgi:hypothetical protein
MMVQNLIQNVLGCLTLFVLLSACSTSPPVEILELNTKPVDRPALILPQADEVRMRPIEWIIITPENQETVFSQLKEDGKPASLFGLPGSGYEDISRNINDIRRYIEQQDTIILAYQNYYVRADRALEDAVVVE